MKTPKERIITAIIILMFVFALFSIIVYSTGGISLSAKSAVLYQPQTDNYLYEKNPDVRLPMASTTKIMTAIVATEALDPNELVLIPKEACGKEGSSIYLTEGETLTFSDLLHGLLLSSANDAACAIALSVSGSIENFASLMNEKAEQMGLSNTHFENPHGLDSEAHYTTARELAKIGAAALDIPLLKEIMAKKTATITNLDGTTRYLYNHNKLLNLYDGAIGIKTGFTKKSGRCLVGACEKDGLTFVTVTINAPSDWSDHMKMFDMGYSLLELRTPAKAGEFSYSLPILNSDKNAVIAENEEGFTRICKKSDNPIETQVSLKQFLLAPIKKGDKLGRVDFYLDGEIIGGVDIICKTDADLVKKKNFFNINN